MAISKNGDLTRFNTYITKKQHKRLESISEESGEHISSHIRKAIEVYFSHYANEKEKEKAIVKIEGGYERGKKGSYRRRRIMANNE